jgi:hypothetical protein
MFIDPTCQRMLGKWGPEEGGEGEGEGGGRAEMEQDREREGRGRYIKNISKCQNEFILPSFRPKAMIKVWESHL